MSETQPQDRVSHERASETMCSVLISVCALKCCFRRELALQESVCVLNQYSVKLLVFLIPSCMLKVLCDCSVNLQEKSLDYLEFLWFLLNPEARPLERLIWSKSLVSVGCDHCVCVSMTVSAHNSELTIDRLVFTVLMEKWVLQGLCSRLGLGVLPEEVIFDL